MAERASRKSSILKAPNQRAPLQDVSTLDLQSVQDEEITSHTAKLRRRVSFAGKNFVKEFCSEADIASVYHAPEYEEELLISSDSSGMPSDRSNAHSYSSVNMSSSSIHFNDPGTVEDDEDECAAIMRQFRGKATPKPPATQPAQQVRKTRFSFGEIQVPSDPFASQDAQRSYHNSSRILCESNQVNVSKIINVSQPVEKIGNSEHNLQNTQLFTSRPVSDQVNSLPVLDTFPPNFSTSDAQSCNNINSNMIGVSEYTERVQSCVNNIVSTDCADKTIIDDSGMEFTAPIYGSIQCNIPVAPIYQSPLSVIIECSEYSGVSSSSTSRDKRSYSDAAADESPNIQDVCYTNKTEMADENSANVIQCMNDSMELTRVVPSTIPLGCHGIPTVSVPLFSGIIEASTCKSPQTKKPRLCKREETNDAIQEDVCAGNVSMEMTRGVPANVEVYKETNQTIAGCGSMEMTRGVPVNDEVYKETNQTLAGNVSMEITQMVPANIAVYKETNRTSAGSVSMKTSRGIPANVEVFRDTNQTLAGNVSMEMTRGVPANVEVCKETNQTLARCESMEMTRGVPANDEEYKETNQTLAGNVSMEMTQMVPANVEVHKETNRTLAGNVSMKTSRGIPANVEVFRDTNQTLAGNVSMEITRGVPANVEVCKETNQTLAGCESMEITRGVPANDEVYKETNQTLAGNVSMEMTQMVPANVEVHKETNRTLAGNVSMKTARGIPANVEVFRDTNQTLAGNVSMEITRGVPANVEVYKETNQTLAGCESMEMIQGVPANVEVNRESNNLTLAGNVPMESTRVMLANVEVDRETNNQTLGRNVSMEMTEEVPATIELCKKPAAVSNTILVSLGSQNLHISRKSSDCVASSVNNFSLNRSDMSGSLSYSKENGEGGTQFQERISNNPGNLGPCVGKSMQLTQALQSASLLKDDSMKSSIGAVEASLEFDVDRHDSFSHQAKKLKLTGSNEVHDNVSMETTKQPSDNINVDVVESGNITGMSEFLGHLPKESGSVFTDRSISEQSGVASISIKTTGYVPEIGSTRVQTQFVDKIEQYGAKDKQKMPMVGTSSHSQHNHGMKTPSSAGIIEVQNLSESSLIGNPFKSKPILCHSPNACRTSDDVQLPTSTQIKCPEVVEAVLGDLDVTTVSEKTGRKSDVTEEMYSTKHVSLYRKDELPNNNSGIELLDLSKSSVNTSINSAADLLHTTIQTASKNVEDFLMENQREMGSKNFLTTGEDAIGFLSEDINFENTSAGRRCDQIQEANSSEKSSSLGAVPSEMAGTSNPIYVSPSTPNIQSAPSVETLGDASVSSSSHESSLLQDINPDDVIHSYMKKKQRRYWVPTKEENDLWSFKFITSPLELKVHTIPKVYSGDRIESHSGSFIFHTSESDVPLYKIASEILRNKLSGETWSRDLEHSTDFMSLLQKISDVVAEVSNFLVEMILTTADFGVTVSEESMSFDLSSYTSHIWFRVTIKMDYWENFTPEHVRMENVIPSSARESEVQKLVTGVKKDIFFLKNYIKDLEDYIKTLESFTVPYEPFA